MKNNINFDQTQYIESLKKKEFLKNERMFLFAGNRKEDL